MSRTRPPSQADGGLARGAEQANSLLPSAVPARGSWSPSWELRLPSPLCTPLPPQPPALPPHCVTRPFLRCGVCPGNKNRFSFFKYLLVVRPVFLVGASEEAQGPHADVSPHLGLFPAGCNSFFGVPRAPGQAHAARVTCCSDGLHSVIMGAGDGGGWVRRRFLKVLLRTEHRTWQSSE